MKYVFTTVLLLLCMFLLGQNNKTKKVAILEVVDKKAINDGIKLMVQGSLSFVI